VSGEKRSGDKIVRVGTAAEVNIAHPVVPKIFGTPLLLQTVFIPGAKTDEGLIVEAVALPWFDIIRAIQDDPSIAFQISPEKWEEIVATAYRRANFDEVTVTPRSGDLGRDVIAIKHGLGTIRVIDQVKAFGPDHRVTANDVRALVGVLEADKVSKGFVTTTSDFAPKIQEDPLIRYHVPARLELIKGERLLARLSDLAGRGSIRLRIHKGPTIFRPPPPRRQLTDQEAQRSVSNPTGEPAN
jgi:restriction system protein